MIYRRFCLPNRRLLPPSDEGCSPMRKGKGNFWLPLTRELSSETRLRERRNIAFICLNPFSPSVTATPCHHLGSRLGRCFCFAEVSAGHPHPHQREALFFTNFYCSVLWQPQQSLSASHGRGGKKSSVGNLIFLKVSQGRSVESSHCFSGMQKSYTGISI